MGSNDSSLGLRYFRLRAAAEKHLRTRFVREEEKLCCLLRQGAFLETVDKCLMTSSRSSL